MVVMLRRTTTTTSSPPPPATKPDESDDNDDDNDDDSGVVYVVVFAHPDDESMFFLPTIRHLVDSGETVWWLCLTTGDYDGLGRTRTKELERAGKLLGASRVLIRNDDDDDSNNNDSESERETGMTRTTMTMMRDHPTRRYDRTVVARSIGESLSRAADANDDAGGNNHRDNHKGNRQRQRQRRYVLITFDEMGVSGHVNHTDVYLGVMRLLQEQRERRKLARTGTAVAGSGNGGGDDPPPQPPWVVLEAWYLHSERNLPVKYLPILSWILVLVSWVVPGCASTVTIRGVRNHRQQLRRRYTRVYRMHDPARNWAAMAAHESQFVWYRRLFVVFSCYAYRNQLLCVRAEAAATAASTPAPATTTTTTTTTTTPSSTPGCDDDDVGTTMTTESSRS